MDLIELEALYWLLVYETEFQNLLKLGWLHEALNPGACTSQNQAELVWFILHLATLF